MKNTPNNKLRPVTEAKSFVDTFADIGGVSGYSIDGVDYVNFSFIKHACIPHLDDDGQPFGSTLSMEKVASITMTKRGAQAMYGILKEMLLADSKLEKEVRDENNDSKE
ncbi:hypothetical protein I2492_19590 [Budviciaceae bacterium CWB-B4]|uniref:Uncharacterized protein n=1 Tax=Limnobaculum xujianqingii TaxID=2738837 RepID=A0A9D7ALL4_9GAMM|nr:hypothetical protein [Limnobaculum xujianqingii]MBK5075195.1 hypothetical protein [Limnobaculum xujianqingii]MBK5178511.1 hypothetical protein [Limnobaculum xujianqingii]